MAKEKFILDASTIISISERCLIRILRNFAMGENIELVMPQSVYKESVERPMHIKRFGLNAMRIKQGVDEGWLTVAKTDSETKRTMKKLDDLTNNMFYLGKNVLKLVHEGETEALALIKKYESNILVIDERTTRMIIEDPIRLSSYLEFKYGSKVTIEENKLFEFKKFMGKFDIARSVELIAMAYEKNYFEPELEQNYQSLSAALYAVKYAGCAVSLNEIEEYLRELG